MKTLRKTGISLLILALITSLMISGCKKDDDQSIPGYFEIDGTKHELAKVYLSKRINNDPGHENEDNYDLVFTGGGITLTDISGMPSGNGDMFAVILTTKSDTDGIESGEYEYGESETLPFLYSSANFLLGYKSESQTMDEQGNIDNQSVISVEKSNGIYEFSINSVTEDGRPFIFSFKGSVIELASHEI